MWIPVVWVVCTLFTLFHIECVETQVEDSLIVKPSFTEVIGQNVIFGEMNLFIYKNIPYAKSLTNLSRFEPPESLSEWTETIPNKTTPCPQVFNHPNDPNYGNIIGEEDCLLLDVYSTQAPQNKKKLPVFVYFHGGKFSNGHKDEYIPSYLMRDGDMIVVIPNYRLGILGFLCTQDREIPGNMGLLDQQMVLQWVNENIEAFGGNKSHVTIGGHGAGGVSASLHILSTKSQEYFSAAITGSGSSMDPWAMLKRSRDSAEDLAKQVSCPTASSNSMVTCLRNTPLEDLLSAQRTFHNITFGPVVDGIFLTDKPNELYLKQIKSVPLLAGVTKDEASLEFFTEFEEASKESNLDTMLTHLLFRYLDGTNNPESVIKAAKHHYLRGITAPDLMSMHEIFINLMTDFLYISGMIRMLTSHSSLNDNIWMYVFQYEGTSLGDVFGPVNDKYSGLYGVSHMDDVVYLFNTTFADWIWKNNKDIMVSKLIPRYSKIWKTFILTRELSSYGKWNFSTEKKYIEFTGKAEKSVSNYRPEEMDFWNLLVPDLQSLNSSNGHDEQQIMEQKLSTTNWGVAGLAITLAVLCVALAGAVVVMRKQIATKCVASPNHDRKTSGV